MANIRQYIGARYVIKIYENSQDPSSAEWEQGNYEPLVMVTWQNGSYVSKKDVPASVGNPANNPTYWAQTGFYNGQIAAIQQQLSNYALSFTTEELNAKHETINNPASSDHNALDVLNSGGQDGNDMRGLVVHNYTDSTGIRLDHVGSNVMMEMVNAHNAVNRPDKPGTFHGDAEYCRYMVQEDYDGDGVFDQQVIGILDANGDIWRSGFDNTGNPARNHTFHIATNKLDGGTWAFNIEAYNPNDYFMVLSDGGSAIARILRNGNGFKLQQGDASANAVIGLDNCNITVQPTGVQFNLDVGKDIYVNKGGQYAYIDWDNNICTSTTRPTTNLHNGMIYRESDTHKLIWYLNGTWYDAMGNAV